jgi:hypothetical protein
MEPRLGAVYCREPYGKGGEIGIFVGRNYVLFSPRKFCIT